MALNVDDLVKSAIMAEMAKSTTAAPAPAPLATAVPAPLVEATAPTLGTNQVWSGKLLGIRKSKDDFPVTMLVQSEIPTEVRSFIPDVDPAYVIQKDQAKAILRAWEMGDKTLVVGPRGSGKSSLIKHLCALTGRPFIRINMTEDAESSNMLGMLAIEGGATVWKDGAITEAVRFGAVCLVDEWDVTPPGIMFALQNLLEDGGYLYLKEKPGTSVDRTLHPHANFRLVMAGNTLGQGDETGDYAGTAVQNSATLDRFGTTVHIGYLSAEHEIAILTGKVKGLSPDACAKMVKVAQLVRDANQNGDMTLTMSPRTLLSWGKKAAMCGSLSEALEFAFINKLRSQDQRMVKEFVTKVFGVARP
jgi:cobaltochelatase CobS